MNMKKREVTPNTYGIEVEYSSFINLPNDKPSNFTGTCHQNTESPQIFDRLDSPPTDNISSESICRALEQLGITSHESFLSNGARLYLDASGFEYATPETTTAEEAVLRSYDGDNIIYRVLGKMLLADEIGSFQLNRKSVDHSGSARGIHLNTTTMQQPRTYKTPEELVRLHQTLNVAKGAMFGAGGLIVSQDGSTTDYYYSPRLAITDTDIATSSFVNKPLFRSLIKPDIGCGRLETVAGDMLSFPWQLKASLVMTNAMQRLFECNLADDMPTIIDPLGDAQWVGRYGHEANVKVSTTKKSNISIKAVDLLKDIATIARDVDSLENIFDSETKQILDQVIDVANIINKDPMLAMTQVESIARKVTLDRRMNEKDLSIESAEICKLDFFWDKIGGGLAERLREKNKAGWLGFNTTNNSIATRKRRLNRAPKDTRAQVRGYLIENQLLDGISGWGNFLKLLMRSALQILSYHHGLARYNLL